MKKILRLILISCCFLFACNKNSALTPKSAPKQLQIVVSNITTTLTIYNFSVINQSSVKLIDVYAQTDNNTYTVDVNSGDVLKLNYFLELEGLSPATDPVLSFIYEGAIMASVTNHAGIISGSKYITIP
ncbi:MAG TPA: hypothetical protein VNW95_14375 [Mucilaginibacter sp.]|jgi:hypothetical protein|nr:hypothetical protein [Mucilaginibacter sp.]